ncbi:MAG: hypothetical protein WA093_02000 [Minisyncoccales bacterium]
MAIAVIVSFLIKAGNKKIIRRRELNHHLLFENQNISPSPATVEFNLGHSQVFAVDYPFVVVEYTPIFHNPFLEYFVRFTFLPDDNCHTIKLHNVFPNPFKVFAVFFGLFLVQYNHLLFHLFSPWKLMSEAMSRVDVALGNDELWHPQGTPRRNSHLIKEEDNGRVAISDE